MGFERQTIVGSDDLAVDAGPVQADIAAPAWAPAHGDRGVRAVVGDGAREAAFEEVGELVDHFAVAWKMIDISSTETSTCLVASVAIVSPI